MNSSALLRQVEAGDAPLFQFLRFLLLAGGILFLALLSLLPLPWPQQFVFGGITVALVLWLDRSSGSYLVTLTLLLLSTFSTLRYGYWRLHTTDRFLIGSKTSLIDAAFILLLLFAEIYAAITLFLCSCRLSGRSAALPSPCLTILPSGPLSISSSPPPTNPSAR